MPAATVKFERRLWAHHVDRRAFAVKEPPRLAGTNTYVIAAGSLSLRNHLARRGLLRADPVLREAYAEVKRR